MPSQQMLVGMGAGGFEASGGTETTYSSGGTNYKVHTFTTSGNFIPTGDGTVDILVIAGGGGGGTCNTSFQGGGGGGAGGYITSVGTSGANSSAISSINVSAQNYVIQVGGGGSGGANGESQLGTSGSNSVALGVTANGGGYGGSNQGNAANGG